MPYFDDLKKDLSRLLEWADVRHEQGAKVRPAINALRRRIAALTAEMRRAGPSRAIADNEPNPLPEILAERPNGPRQLWCSFDAREYRRRVKGAFLARAAGCTLGAIVEGWQPHRMQALAGHCKMAYPPTDYWTFIGSPWDKRYDVSRCEDYLRQKMTHVPVDDDVVYTVLGLLILEEHGPDFTTADVGEAWLKYLPMACTAEHVALENLKAGVPASKAGEKGNPYMEWIGADIRSDPWGYAAPGWPEKAAELAYRDAWLSHRYNGIYGEMYFAAAIAAAFACDDPLDACRIALSEIPRSCRLTADVTWALKQAGKLKDWQHGRKLVDERFPGMHSVHTNNNACLTIFGLALGGRDVTAVLGNTVAMGYDNDCTAATAGSIVGACVGIDGVPEHWYKPFRNKMRTYLKGVEWMSIPDILARFAKAARAVWDTDCCCCCCEA
jgi:ADP-ribosylglycohydrolase